MTMIGTSQFLERLQFFNGERLFAADLQALESFNRQLRWLHNQSLHQPGIGSGFAVIGNIGDRQVTISPGYALDACGREIILTEVQVQQIPPVSDNGSGGSVFYDLTVSYPDDAELKPSETRAGICTTAGVVRLREAPVFCWVRLNDDPTNPQPIDSRLKARINNNLFILLARVEIFNCQLKQPVSTALRVNARPSERPRIAAGIETQSAWNGPTSLQAGSESGSLGVAFAGVYYSRSVDTTCGKFQATPGYSARLAGPRQFVAADGSSFIADALINIANDTTTPGPSPEGFTVQVFPVVAAIGGATVQSTDLQTAVEQWDIAWIGVEG
jgi:hypothetical protein